jgi:hypothetical protein
MNKTGDIAGHRQMCVFVAGQAFTTLSLFIFIFSLSLREHCRRLPTNKIKLPSCSCWVRAGATDVKQWVTWHHVFTTATFQGIFLDRGAFF